MSATEYRQFTLSLTVKAPFLSHKAGAQQFGFDMSMFKDDTGTPAFLGSLIRGNIRHTLEHFKTALGKQKDQKSAAAIREITAVLELFGQKSYKENDSPERADLTFDYYWKLDEDGLVPEDQPRYRIGINKSSGTVDSGNLQVIEACYKQGGNAKFTGKIHGKLSREQADQCQKWLDKAAQYLAAIGALKGTGFGRLEAAAQQIKLETPKMAETIPVIQDRIGILIKPDRPICIAKPHIVNDNRFSSEEFIPGNVIIGTIARQFPKEAEKNWFNRLRVSHALPMSEKDQNEKTINPTRQAVLPLSLGCIQKDNKSSKETVIFDLALCKPELNKALLIKINNKLQAPSYQPDWKYSDFKQAKAACNLIDYTPQRQLIVRTAIEIGTNHADKGKLFSLDCVMPGNTIWCADIDFSGIEDEDDRSEAKRVIANVIKAGLQGLGKTDAIAGIAEHPSFYNEKNIHPIKEQYILTLQTPARLFAAPNNLSATSNEQALFELYDDYWKTASHQQLTLSHYFAQQTKMGGEFYRKYYQPKDKSKRESYQPQWMTNPGSVFVLKATKEANIEIVHGLLAEWQKLGLPQAQDKIASDWQNNPYIRQNGFGEIRVNDPIHTELALAKLSLSGEWL
jgi:hypothetical protein